MGINPNMAEIAALLGETSRATILASMMDGRFHTASELAYMAAIKPQTASFHLAKLVEGKLIKVEKQGRHRYFQLAGEDIAQFLESFLAISPPPEVRSLKQSSQIKLLQVKSNGQNQLPIKKHCLGNLWAVFLSIIGMMSLVNYHC